MEQFTVLTALTGELIEKLKLSNRLPANGHTLVSNLPGPGEPRYMKGARVEQMYPISVLVPGLRMNITLFSLRRHPEPWHCSHEGSQESGPAGPD